MEGLSARFIAAYTRLDAVLRQRTGKERADGTSFAGVVDAASSQRLIRRVDAAHLKQMGQLRNAIVHDERYPGRAIAEPHMDIVLEIETLLENVIGEKSVMNIATRNPHAYSGQDSLDIVLSEMKRGDFSQVVVRQDASLGLLTTDGIASWLEDNYSDDGLRADNVTVSDVLRFEKPRRFQLVAKDAPLSQTIAIFEAAATSPIERLFALLVTHSGKQHESCIGIVTSTDAFAAR